MEKAVNLCVYVCALFLFRFCSLSILVFVESSFLACAYQFVRFLVPLLYTRNLGQRWHVATRFRAASASDVSNGRPLVVTMVVVGDLKLSAVADRIEWRQSFTSEVRKHVAFQW